MLVTWWTGLCVMCNLDVQEGLSCLLHLGPMRTMWNLENAHGDLVWSGSRPHVDPLICIPRDVLWTLLGVDLGPMCVIECEASCFARNLCAGEA